MRPDVRDRIVAGIGTALVTAGLGVVLVLGLSVDIRTTAEHALTVLTIQPPPPPPPPPPPHPLVKPHAKGRAAPRNLRNKATPVVAPPPVVIPPKPPPIVVAPKPNIGTASQTGASDRAGSGQGAGGSGDGYGGGGDGDGDGDIAPEQIGGRLKQSDLPLELAGPGVEYKIGVRYYVGADGHVGECGVTRSSGHADFDARVCQLIRQRFRFRPARDLAGRPHGGYIVETHSWGVDREDYPGDAP